MIPYWFWFLTMATGLGAIALSAIVIIIMKLRELDERQLARVGRMNNGKRRN